MPKKNAVKMRSNAERAGEHYAHEIHGCVVTCRAVRTKWQRQDMFGSDILGKQKDGTLVAIQVTAGQNSAVTARRRKLEAIPWRRSDLVELLQLTQTKDPANYRRILYFFRVHTFAFSIEPDGKGRSWHTLANAVPVPREWFKAWKPGE